MKGPGLDPEYGAAAAERRTDAALLPPVTFRRVEGEGGSARHARRAQEAAEREVEIAAHAVTIGAQLDTSRPGWYRLTAPRIELLWRPALAAFTGRVDEQRLPSMHVLDVDGWREQTSAVLAARALDLSRVRPYACPVVAWRQGTLALARSRRTLELDWDSQRRCYLGDPAEVWAALLRVHVGATGVSPTKLFPIVGARR